MIDLQSQEWDEKNQQVKKSHPNHQAINLKLAQKQAEQQKLILKLEEAVPGLSVHTIRDHFLYAKKRKIRSDVFSFAEDQIHKLKAAGRYGNAATYERALGNVPDLILCDVMMPEMDGFEACRRLKSDRRTSHIPIILLTAKATQEDKIAGLMHGADAYLTKPFDNIGIDLFDTNHLCRAVAMSRTQLHRKLKALTGQSAAAFIRSFRLQKARTLQETTDLPIGEISLQVGYKDFSHFSRSYFKVSHLKHASN